MQIARALMTDPELLLLDEPAAGLDLGGREDLVSTLSVLAMDEMSPATVLVSHHVEEIPPGFTHALLLREGRVVAAGPLRAGAHRGGRLRDVRHADDPAPRGRPLGRPAARPAATRDRAGLPGRRIGWRYAAPRGFDAWQAWLGLAVALGVLELFSLDLILLMLAAGAVVGMVAALVGLDLWVQVLAAVAASVAALGAGPAQRRQAAARGPDPGARPRRARRPHRHRGRAGLLPGRSGPHRR